MNRNKISLIILVMLLVVSAWLLLSRRSGTYARSDVEFAVQDTNLIRAVEIMERGGKVSIIKHGNTWLVNGSSPVRRDLMSGLLIMLSRLDVISPVSRSRSQEISRLLVDGKRVFINLERGEDKEYFVYHDTSETDATYMMQKDGDTPFRMGVRGYKRRDLASLYVTDERYWRENLLLHYLPDQIQSFSLQNKEDPARTFHLARNAAGEFEISTGLVPGEWSTPVAAKLRQYLGYFYGIRFETYADLDEETFMKYESPDEPVFILEVGDYRGKQTSISLYPAFTVDPEGNKKKDLNVLYAKIDDWDGMVLLRYLEIDPLLKDPGYFQSK